MTRFNPLDGLIIVNTRIFGPTGDLVVRLALDTGASFTMVRNAILITIGYDRDTLPKTVSFTTGSGVESAASVTVDRLTALGQERAHFPVTAHTLPPTARIDGVSTILRYDQRFRCVSKRTNSTDTAYLTGSL